MNKLELRRIDTELKKFLKAGSISSFQSGDTVYLTVRDVNEWPGGFLKSLTKIVKLYKGNDLDMPSMHTTEGCPTCGYGGYETWEFNIKGCK